MRVNIKNGNSAGTTLTSHTCNPLDVACMHEFGLITNKVIANSINMVKNDFDLNFDIIYFMKKQNKFMLKTNNK